MNKELAKVLKTRLLNLPFVDVMAGLAQTVTRDDQDSETAGKITTRFPVSYDTNQPVDCLGGPEKLLIPDSNRKSIIYFEDFGITEAQGRTGRSEYTSSIRLVCWMNRALLVGDIYKEVSGPAMAIIIEKLKFENPINFGMFQGLRCQVSRIPPQEAGVFGRYTYTEQQRQYLRPPFEFFAIDFVCKFYVSPNCIDQIQWTQKTCY